MAMLPSLPTSEYSFARMPPQADQMSSGGGRRSRRKKPRGGEKLAGEAKRRRRRLSDEQVRLLETSFGIERKLGSGRKAHLASELGLEPRRVAVWFQNRRARWKSKQLEEEFLRLRCLHDGVVLHKRHLEAEVLRLKEQLSEAEEEIRKLSAAGSSGAATCGEKISSSSSRSSSFDHRPLLSPVPDLAGAGGGGGLAYVHGYSDNANMVDWLTDHPFITSYDHIEGF